MDKSRNIPRAEARTPEEDMASSDDLRSASYSSHLQRVRFNEPLALESGGVLPALEVAYEVYGSLAPARDNAVLICHAITGDSHVARHDANDLPGWWEIAVGPGKAIDTDRYFVVCANILGGCRGTTGPNSIDPSTGKPYGAEFPLITITDMVEAQRRLIDHLNIRTLHGVIGGSLGGHQAIVWATKHSDRVRNAALIATSPRLNSQALAFDVVARNAILRDPHFHAGQYYDKPQGPAVGLALARMLGHITYLSLDAMTRKFDSTRSTPRDVDTAFEKMFSVGSYLAYQGHKFVERFDANSYVAITRALDLFDLGDTRAQLAEAFRNTSSRFLALSFSSDWLFPPAQSRQIVDALLAEGKPVSYCNIQSNCGHDAFLLEDDLPSYGALLKAFLNRPDAPLARPGRDPRIPTDPLNIFAGHRLEHDLILDLIPDNARVLDLGCGDGTLMALLAHRKKPSKLLGLELDEREIIAAVERGLEVIQWDLEQPLGAFAPGQFDVVVLSQTLQSVSQTENVIDEMLRVGKRGIVSFPNFGFHKLRKMYVEQGRVPKTDGIYAHEWFNTPNRRFPTILDFQDFCRQKGVAVQREIYLDTEHNRRVTDDPNVNADVAIFVLGRS